MSVRADVETTVPSERQPQDEADLRQRRWTAIPGKTSDSGPCDRPDDAIRSDPADSVCVSLGEVECAVGSEGQIGGVAKPGLRSRNAIGSSAGCIEVYAGDHRYRPVAAHSDDLVRVRRRDVERTVGSSNDSRWVHHRTGVPPRSRAASDVANGVHDRLPDARRVPALTGPEEQRAARKQRGWTVRVLDVQGPSTKSLVFGHPASQLVFPGEH